MSALESAFYVTGGTLRQDAPSYVERQADRDLLEGLLQGEFCYVLTSRQMGKSSLMVRTAGKLREQHVHVVVLDLTAIGQNLTPEQWYDGLLVRLGRQLRVEDPLEDFWKTHEHLGPCDRFFSAIREVALRECGAQASTFLGREEDKKNKLPLEAQRVVIFVDEIDVVRSLPFSTDEFFAAIRECYNRRTEEPVFNQLTFCLLGVASPSDLIRDTRMTPFNIGTRVELHDFSNGEALALAKGLGGRAGTAEQLLERVLYWTSGHPYLTQRLCQTIAAETGQGPIDVDRVCEELFLSHRARERDDNLLFVRERILRSEADLAGLLTLYEQVHQHRRVRDDETNPLVSILRLSGLTRVSQGCLSVRNRIYQRVFDRSWVRANMPDAELRRQRAAFFRGVFRTAGLAVIVIAMMAVLLVYARRQHQLAEARLYAADMHLAYQAWESDNLGLAKQLLNAHRRHRPDFRGFEWRYLWNRCQGADEMTLRGSGNFRQVFFSPDGKAVLARSMDRLLNVWDLSSRRLRFSVTNVWSSAEFFRNGTEMIIGRADSWADFVSPQNGGFLGRFRLSGLLLGASADGRILVTGESNATKLWNSQTGQEVFSLPEPSGVERFADSEAAMAVLSPDASLLATWDNDQESGQDRIHAVSIWETKTTNRVRRGSRMGDVRSMAFSMDNAWLAVACASGSARLVSPRTDAPIITLKSGEATLWAVTFSPDARKLATAGSDQTVRVWEIASGRELVVFKGHENGVQSVAFSPDGTYLASGGRDGTVRIWNLQEKSEITVVTNLYGPLRFSDDGGLIAVRTQNRTISILKSPSLERVLEIPTADLPLGLTSNQLFVGGADRTASLRVHPAPVNAYDLSVGSARIQLLPHSGMTNQVLVVRNFKARLAVAMDSVGQLQLQHLITGEELGSLISLNGSTNFNVTLLSDDGKWFLTGGTDRKVRIWDLGKRQELPPMEAHNPFVSALAVSPDSKTLATGGGDNAVKIWSIRTGKLRATFQGHRQYVMALSFSPDGKRLASSSSDRIIRLWDLDLLQEVASFQIPETSLIKGFHGVHQLIFSPDGNTLAAMAGNLPHILKLWRAPSWEQIAAAEAREKAAIQRP